MTRRSAVLWVGGVLLLLLGVLGAALPVPYVLQRPGPTFDTLGEISGEPLIRVEGRGRNEVSGELRLTTIYASQGGISLVQAVHGWFNREQSVVPEETVYPPDQTVEETRREDREAFLSSEEAAETVALRRLGFPEKVVVQGLTEESPSKGVLEEGDAIEGVDGRRTPDAQTLEEVLSAIPGGSTVTVDYTRLGQPASGTVTTRPAGDRPGSLLGIQIRDQPSAPFDLDVNVEKVGGPSAGLMLSLGILDLVGDTDLTDGAVVAGSGTIDAEGNVGRIGVIQLKMMAAAEIGADLFLVPADNCADALAAAEPGLPLARVATLDDALTALADLRAGRTPTPC